MFQAFVSVRSSRCRTVACAVAVLTGLLLSAAAAAEPAGDAARVKQILESRCYGCHGQDGTDEGGFNAVLDRDRMVATARIVPGQPAERSLLYRQIASGRMPQDDDPLADDELALFRRWLENGAADFTPEQAPVEFITPEQMFSAIRGDLQQRAPRYHRYQRYFSLTHLYNAGRSEDELQTYRHGLSKLVNSLSWGRRVVRPETIGPHGTILRIDLRDYAWNEEIWDKIQDADPYALKYGFEDARFCYEATECDLLISRGDWFVHAAARPPLYHDLLQLPDTARELEKLLRIDVEQNIEQDIVARAGFNGSGVSRNNRLLERHESPYGSYWKSYDFAKNSGRANLFAHPLGPGDEDSSFSHNGGEIIFSLPNGLQGYLLVDGNGNRIDNGPIAIVSDPKSPDKSVVNGLSCMSCHVQGMIEKSDQVRNHVLKFRDAFDDGDVEKVEAIYPKSDEFASLLNEDRERYRRALEDTGAPLTQTDTVWTLANRFDERLDAALAAAEAGIPESRLLELLDKVPSLARRLGPLATGQTIQREVYTNAFDDLVLQLRQEFALAVERATSTPSDLPAEDDADESAEQLAAVSEDESASGEEDSSEDESATASESTTVTVERGPINPTGDPVEAQTELLIGQKVQVRQGESWWRAEVVATYGDGTVEVDYVGWAEKETVPRSRVLIAPTIPSGLRMPDADKRPIVPTGIPVTTATPLKVGDFVQVEQIGAWWKGRVLRLQADGRVLIHYLGYKEADDEVVPRSRILLPRDASGKQPDGYSVR